MLTEVDPSHSRLLSDNTHMCVKFFGRRS